MTTTYIPVTPPCWLRWRRRLRRVPWTGLLWLAGAGGVLGWYAVNSDVDLWQLPLVAAGYLILLGAALAPNRP